MCGAFVAWGALALPVGAAVRQEAAGEARVDWIVERWPIVAEVEAASAAGDLEGARAKFDAWIATDVAALFEGLDADQVLAVAARAEVVAAPLERPEVKLAVRRAVCERLATLPTPDDPRRVAALERLASAHAESGDLDATLAVFDEVHTLLAAHRAADDEKLLRAKSNLAAALHRVGQFERAVDVRNEVVTVYAASLPDEDPRLVRARTLYATALEQLGRHTEARDLRRGVFEVLERTLPPGDQQRIDAHGALGTSYAECGEWAAALEAHEAVLAHYEASAPPQDPRLINALVNAGIANLKMGDFATAGERLQRAHASASGALPPEHPLRWKASTALAGWHELRGELRDALALDSELLALLEQLPSVPPRDRLRTESNVAQLQWRMGDHVGALSARRRVLAALEQLVPPDHTERINAELDLSGSLLEIGRSTEALELAQRALASCERAWPDNIELLTTAWTNVAAAQNQLGDFEGARVLRERVVDELSARFDDDHPSLVLARASLAATLHGLGENDAALELRRRVLEARERSLPMDHPDRIAAATSLANSLAASGDLEGARAIYEEQLVRSRKLYPPEHRRLLQLLANLAAVLQELGESEAAIERFDEVLAASTAIETYHAFHVRALSGRAKAQLALDDHEGLRATVLELFESTNDLAESLATQSPRVARAAVQEAVMQLSSAVAWDRAIVAADLPSVATEFFGALEGLRHAARAAVDVERLAAQDVDLAGLAAELAWRRKEAAEAALVPPGDPAQLESWRADLLERARRRERCESELRRALIERGASVLRPAAASVAAALPEDAAFVSYWRCGTGSTFGGDTRVPTAHDLVVAFVVEPDGDVTLVELEWAKAIERLVADWRAALGHPLERGLEPVADAREAESIAARALRAALLDPCLAVVTERGVRRLHVVLDDVLHLVPIDALALEGDERLGSRLAIVIENTTERLVAPRASREPRGGLVAFGGIDYGADVATSEAAAPLLVAQRGSGGVPASFAPLLSSRFEAEYVGALYEESGAGEPTLLLRERADKRTLAALAPQARYLHVATHGWFAPESSVASILDHIDAADRAARDSADRARDAIVGFLPETLCGLALAGANNGPEGILTAEELATLDLSNCELAVLSACETNVGIRRAGQGIQSLQTALHAAGARTAITSLWKVDDAATRRLFELFYTKLWSEKLGPADALWQAKMALRSEGHPTRDWAGWVLTGDPD